jgi:hypothetical protein
MAFVGALDAFNSQPIQTKVGTSQTNIFTATSTKVTKDTSGKVNGGTTTVYFSANAGSYVPAATTTDGGKTWTYLKDSNGKEIFGADAKKSLEQGALKNNTQQQILSATKKGPLGGGGLTPEEQKVIAPKTQNTATTAGIGTTSTEGSDDIAKEINAGFKEGTRFKEGSYPDVKYPLNLKLENQDCIKFSIFEYKAPGLTPNSSLAGSRIVKLKNAKPGFETKDRKILGTITLPIPAGIGDRNNTNWNGNPLEEIEKMFANISMQTIMNGGTGGGQAIQSSSSSVAPRGDTSALQQRLATKAVEAATGSSGILARQFGAIANPNLELLFEGPSLRNFAFNFKFTPREPKEAVEVRKIIRYFKQAMSVKRSKSSLLLRSPHTFAISYLSNNKDHPYLNRFKECALTDCAVNYTPDGTYMTYGDSSMTAYELSLTFQELEPIFDDEYFEIDENKDTSIGF